MASGMRSSGKPAPRSNHSSRCDRFCAARSALAASAWPSIVPSRRSGRITSTIRSRSSSCSNFTSHTRKHSGRGMSHIPSFVTTPKFDCRNMPSGDGP